MKKTTRELFFCLSFLILFYLLIRYPLFFIHGMKQWPLFMLLVAGGSMLGFWLVGRRRMIFPGALFYMLSFVAAKLFSTKSYDQGGGLTDSAWKLWLLFYLVALAIYGLVVERDIFRRRDVS